jgi:hypothetical protein
MKVRIEVTLGSGSTYVAKGHGLRATSTAGAEIAARALAAKIESATGLKTYALEAVQGFETIGRDGTWKVTRPAVYELTLWEVEG